MTFIADILKDKKSKMIISIHDELIFEIHFDEIEIINKIKEAMEVAYPYKHIPLTTSVSYSLNSLSKKDLIEVEGADIGAAIREQIQGKSAEVSELPPEYLVRKDSAALH
jgi:hypothetical protein